MSKIRWAVDPGHTRLKLAVFDGVEVLHSGAWSWADLGVEDAEGAQIKNADTPWKAWPTGESSAEVYALERAGAAERLAQLWWPSEICFIGHADVKHFTHDYVDFKSGRHGMDRWANMAACHAINPKGADIIVDAGTCTTIDLRLGGRLLGGAISPGIALRAQALAAGTDTLPAVKLASMKNEGISFPGRSTEETIFAGVVCGAVEECAGLVRRLLEKYPDARIIVTGGGAHYFDSLPGMQTFADSLLTLKGVMALAAAHEEATYTT